MKTVLDFGKNLDDDIITQTDYTKGLLEKLTDMESDPEPSLARIEAELIYI